VHPTLQMLEETGYAISAERDGKKVYSITQEGRQFLSERKDLANEVESQMRRHWNAENIGKLVQMMGEFGELARLMGRRARYTDPDKMQRIRQVVSRAYQEIEAILEGKAVERMV